MKKGLLAGDTPATNPIGKEARGEVCRTRLGVSVGAVVRTRPRRRHRRRGFAADRDGLARLVLELGDEVTACLEMMSGALWVRDQLVACGWQVEVADARKVKTVAPLAAKTDKVDARLLAELCRRELVPALWLPSLEERALRERLRRRMHLVRLRTRAKARIAGLQTQWGVRVSLARLRRADGLALLERAGVPDVWRRSVSECLAVIDSSMPDSSRSSGTASWTVARGPPHKLRAPGS